MDSPPHDALFEAAFGSPETTKSELELAFPRDGKEGEDIVMTAAEQLRREGHVRGLEEGREEGRVEEARTSLTNVLAARRIELSELGRARIAGCADRALLEQWLCRGAVAASEREVFGD